MSEIYRVVIRTACRACAMALAGRSPALGTVRDAFVLRESDDVYQHANSARIQYHDGSALACPEHGKVIDLSREPER